MEPLLSIQPLCIMFLLEKCISFRKLKFLSSCCTKENDPSGKGGEYSWVVVTSQILMAEIKDGDLCKSPSTRGSEVEMQELLPPPRFQIQTCWLRAYLLHQNHHHSQLVPLRRPTGECSRGFEIRTQIQHTQFSQGTILKTYTRIFKWENSEIMSIPPPTFQKIF